MEQEHAFCPFRSSDLENERISWCPRLAAKGSTSVHVHSRTELKKKCPLCPRTADQKANDAFRWNLLAACQEWVYFSDGICPMRTTVDSGRRTAATTSMLHANWPQVILRSVQLSAASEMNEGALVSEDIHPAISLHGVFHGSGGIHRALGIRYNGAAILT